MITRSQHTASATMSALVATARIIALVAIVVLPGRALAAPAPSAAGASDRPSSAIDPLLLRRLTREIVDEVPTDTTEPAGPGNPSAGGAANGQAPAGGEMHRPQVANPAETLGQVAGAMREAGDLLDTGQENSRVRRLQDRAVQQLDALIEAARATPPPSSSSSSKPQPSDQQPQQGDPKPGQPQQSTQTGTQAGTPGSIRTDAETEAEAERSSQRAQQWMERVWGHLPEREREQLRQFGTDVFLPGYESLIELYFKRLAEEEDE